ISGSKRFQHSQLIAGPGDQPHSTPFSSAPERVPVKSLISEILHTLALLQGRSNPKRRLRLLSSRDKPETRKGFVKMQEIVRQSQSKVHNDKPTVSRGMSMPLAIDPQNYIASVPQSCAEVNFLILMGTVLS